MPKINPYLIKENYKKTETIQEIEKYEIKKTPLSPAARCKVIRNAYFSERGKGGYGSMDIPEGATITYADTWLKITYKLVSTNNNGEKKFLFEKDDDWKYGGSGSPMLTYFSSQEVVGDFKAFKEWTNALKWRGMTWGKIRVVDGTSHQETSESRRIKERIINDTEEAFWKCGGDRESNTFVFTY